MGPGAGEDRCGKSLPHRDSITGPSSPYPVAIPTELPGPNEDVCTFMKISRLTFLRMRNVSDKSCTENQNTHFVFSNVFFENRAVCEIMWKIVAESDRTQMTI
jgi:hypothetical protein